MDTKHTPTPWHVVDNDKYLEIVVPWKSNPEVVDQYCPAVVSCIGYTGNDGIDGHANAAFIVRACNAHEQLVAALKLARGGLSQVGVHDYLVDFEANAQTIAAVDAALTAAGAA